ncbi:MAG: hypothetical protein ACRD3Q_02265 [Terriglobales bacterium]
MHWLGLLLRPLFLVLLFGTAACIGLLIRRALPEGRVKRILTRPVPIVPDPHDKSWLPFLAWLVASLLIWVPLVIIAHRY